MTYKNYMTKFGFNNLKEKLHNLVTKDRPQYVSLVSWAASNGDRSENADYQYGKRKLREIDKEIHYLTKALADAEVIDPKVHQGKNKIYFGATVELIKNGDIIQTIKIVGKDEFDPIRNWISWTSPLARNLIGKSIGDEFNFKSPTGEETIEIIQVVYL